MRTYWGSDGKFKGYSQNFNVGFGIAYILGMVLLAVALYFLPIVAGVVCLISLGSGKDYSLCSVICFILKTKQNPAVHRLFI